MTHKETILKYLQAIYPDTATNSDIVMATGIGPHQQVFKKTDELKKEGTIIGWQVGREWHFSAKRKSLVKSSLPHHPKMTWQRFERVAREEFSAFFQTQLSEGYANGVNKRWDMVSADGKIVGDAKYLKLVKGKYLPPAKFSNISEHVWLLEKTIAEIKFLVFGNQIEVSQKWLKKYGDLVTDVDFYFLDVDRNITLQNKQK